MCGRFGIKISPEEIEDILGIQLALGWEPRGNIAPSQEIFTITQEDASHAQLLKWGIKPAWKSSGLLINAKAETLSEKKTFSGLLQSQRCVIPATCFYEWRKEDGKNNPYKFTIEDEELFLLAGLYTSEGEVVIITVQPNILLKEYHNRMPAILTVDIYRKWLETYDEDLLTPFGSKMNVIQTDPMSE